MTASCFPRHRLQDDEYYSIRISSMLRENAYKSKGDTECKLKERNTNVLKGRVYRCGALYLHIGVVVCSVVGATVVSVSVVVSVVDSVVMATVVSTVVSVLKSVVGAMVVSVSVVISVVDSDIMAMLVTTVFSVVESVGMATVVSTVGPTPNSDLAVGILQY